MKMTFTYYFCNKDVPLVPSVRLLTLGRGTRTHSNGSASGCTVADMIDSRPAAGTTHGSTQRREPASGRHYQRQTQRRLRRRVYPAGSVNVALNPGVALASTRVPP